MISSRNQYRDFCKGDILANSLSADRKSHAPFRRILFPNIICRFLKALRNLEYPHCSFAIPKTLCYYCRLFQYRRLSMRLGFSIPPHVFGPGLSIPHYGTIVVNSNSVVGANCRLHVCTNIGASGGSSGAPHLGNNIYIGPGAIIYGEIVISDNVWIAANATLGKSVLQENVIVAGSPAKIVKDAPDVWWKKNGIDLSYNLTI